MEVVKLEKIGRFAERVNWSMIRGVAIMNSVSVTLKNAVRISINQ